MLNKLISAGLEINGRKDTKCICFFHIVFENCQGNDKKKCVYISARVAQKLYLSTCVLFRNVCFLFLILEQILKRSLFIYPTLLGVTIQLVCQCR